MASRYAVHGRSCIDEAGAKSRVEAAFYGVDASMSNWSDQSEVSRFNALQIGQVMEVSDGFGEVLEESDRLYAGTDGRFDPAVGELIELWGFGVQRRSSLPERSEVEAALRRSGWSGLRLEGRKVRRLRPVRLNPGGIAKGYAVDRAAAVLEEHCRDYFVEAGGEIRMRGQWPVTIQHPNQDGGIARMELKDTAVATSGVYANKRTVDGKRYSHIIDPRTGRPANHATSVTVTGPHCATADGLATALILTEETDYETVLAKFPGYGAIAFVESDQGFRLIRAGATPEVQCTRPAARTSSAATAEASGTTTLLPNCL